MLDFGNYRDDNPPLDLRDDYSPARTSSSDFFQALQDFLGRNQIDFIGPFQMRLEGTSNNNWRLLVEGETSRSNWNTPNQVGLGLAWPSIPSSSDGPSAHETAGARASIASGSSSASDPTYSWILMYQYSQDPGVFPRGGHACSEQLLGE